MPENCSIDRTFSDIFDLLRNRWYNGNCKGEKWFLKGEKLMNEYLKIQIEDFGCPLTGTIGDLGNIPSEAVLRDWKRRSKAHGSAIIIIIIITI